MDTAEDATQVVRADPPDGPTVIMSAAATPDEADATAVRAHGEDGWFDLRLRHFLEALRTRQDGVQRDELELRVLTSAARDMLDRLTAKGADPATAAWPDAVLQPNQVLANTFVVRELIARGGMGEIYRVRHRDLQTDLAVKILLPRFSLDAKIVALLLDEARLLQMVRHDAVVTCHGLLRDSDGRMLLLMEFLRGPTLSARLNATRLPEADVLALARRLGDALGGMHAERIIHQDVSPDNVVLCNGSCREAKLVDFGVARSLADDHSAHDTIDFAGKYSWMSPEQLTPGAAVGPASDFYSLGLVLAAAAQGRKLEMGTDAPSAREHRLRPPVLDDVPKSLRPLLGRLLVADPRRRIDSADELLGALAPKRRGWFGLRK